MSDNQQFCLRWNNHQSTLVQVIDSLLSSGVLVDCTLAAEGQYLHAHKVVLCACSPYLETLLSQHYEKHPIVILKDVKFQELKSMMDYMYKGEVNISQDQLGQFLKAAESLQIKGLTDGGGGENDSKDVGSTSHKRHDPPPIRKSVPPNQSRSSVVLPSHGTGLTIEPSKRSLPSHLSESQPDSPNRSREGSSSPTPRKRRRPRRPSQGDDDGHQDNCDLPMQQQSILNTVPIIPQLPAGSSSTITKAPPPDDEPDQPAESDVRLAESGLLKEKIEPQSELLIEPKTEYMEETNNDDSVEDLTLDDDDEYDNMDGAGPSHGGDNSNQSYGQWQMGERTHDEVFMAAQEAVGGGPRDSQVQTTAPIIRVRSDIPNLKPLNFQNLTTFALLSTTNNFNLQNSTSNAASNVMAISQHYLNKLTCLRMSPSQNWVSSSCDMYDSSSDTSVVSGDHSGLNDSMNSQNNTNNSHSSSGPRKHNREKEPIFGCLDCGKRYRSKTSLSLHKRLECGKEPAFQCPFCPLKTHQKGNLQVHIKKKHSDPRHFVGHTMS